MSYFIFRKKTFLKIKTKIQFLIGFFSCRGCPGRRIFRFIRNLKEEIGLYVVHIASCVLKGTPFPKGLYKKEIIKTIRNGC
ncbi:MAG: CGGC domain-containing protein [Candidatus Lokiarchaeota archaeon]|nr:CGGC domain-containing protein [Candidatus Lokiarchaeota archaeon]